MMDAESWSYPQLVTWGGWSISDPMTSSDPTANSPIENVPCGASEAPLGRSLASDAIVAVLRLRSGESAVKGREGRPPHTWPVARDMTSAHRPAFSGPRWR